MADSAKKQRGLGRGLAALFGEEEAQLAAAAAVGEEVPKERGPIAEVPIEKIFPNRQQPRRHFDEDALDELAQSIGKQGILQPLVVRRHPERKDAYEIVAGERRWRAAQKAQLDRLPVVVRDLDSQTTLEIALVENLQREDLGALEEAEAYRRLVDDFGHSQADIGKAVGKSRSHVANMLRLLALPAEVQDLLRAGQLSAGHARALVTIEDPLALAEMAVAEGWNVREMERRAQERTDREPPRSGGKKDKAPPKDSDLLALESELSQRLGLKVVVSNSGRKGQVTLHYRDLDQLDEILARLRGVTI